MNAKALINSLSTPQLIRARQTALSFCALLDAKKGDITKELTIPQLISTVFIASPSVTSIIASKVTPHTYLHTLHSSSHKQRFTIRSPSALRKATYPREKSSTIF